MPKGIPKDTSNKRQMIHRLKIARGHLDKVIAMVSGDEYCIDVLNQAAAVQSAIKKASKQLLKNHMELCVSDAIKRGKSKDAIDEIIKVFEKS